jgi:hypothetical protein
MNFLRILSPIYKGQPNDENWLLSQYYKGLGGRVEIGQTGMPKGFPNTHAFYYRLHQFLINF